MKGYHDIAQVLLLVLGKPLAMIVLEYMSLFLLRDFMLPSMDSTVDHLRLLPYILKSADTQLAELLGKVEPIYALSSVLTIFSHDIERFDDICIIFDYVLASGSMIVPLYLYASVVISRKDELMALDTDDCDVLHSVLSNFPSPISATSLFDATARASTLLELYPPQSLENWSIISEFSVLRSTAAPQPPGRRYSSVHDHLERLQRPRKGSARSRLSSSTSATIEAEALEKEPVSDTSDSESHSEEETSMSMVQSIASVNSMMDSIPAGSDSLISPPDSVCDSSYHSYATMSDTDEDNETEAEADEANDDRVIGSIMLKKGKFNIGDTLRLLRCQVEESNRKLAEKKRREQEAAQQRKRELEQRRQENAAKRAAAEESKAKSTPLTKFASATTLGLISPSRIAEVFPTITHGSGALVHHLTRNLKSGSKILTPTTVVGVSIYFGLFSILAYAFYYNQDMNYEAAGMLRRLDFRAVWEKMVVRYFQLQ